jgi:uncharacterized membrane protein
MEFDLPHTIATLVTFAILIVSVTAHYEGLSALSRWVGSDPFAPRVRIAVLIFGQMMLHIVEILIFAAGYFVLSQKLGFGDLIQGANFGEPIPVTQTGYTDFIYYSAVVYSTLGFGDVVPTGPLRILTGIEGVAGLVLITWSASFTFLEMLRHWGRD